MSEFKPNDAQRAAIRVQGRDLLVTAGAGTGKTTVLIERILYKLREGIIPSIDDLLVVTFTEKAAREMKDRLYHELARDPRLRSQLPLLPRAAISTIDGYCGRLLREHFLEARLEPAFRILDEHGSVEALHEAMRRTFHDWYALRGSEEGAEFQSLVEMAGFDEQGEVLRKIVARLLAYARVTRDPDAFLDALYSRAPAGLLADLPWYPEMRRRLCEDLWPRGLRLYGLAIERARENGCNPDAMENLRERLEAAAGDLFSIGTQREAVEALARAGCLRLGETRSRGGAGTGLRIAFPNAPRGANRIPGFAEAHKAAKDTFDHPLVRSLPWNTERLLEEDVRQQKSLSVIVQVVRAAEEHYRLYKSRHGFLDFADLEYYAARLIREHGEALGLAERFHEVLVDEFQDVNALQDEILRGLSRERGRFRVGDVKQSIYQFRLADPTIFLGLAGERPHVEDPLRIPEGDGPLLLFLAENHRSRPGLLEFANHIFEGLFTAREIGSGYEDQALKAGRAAGDGAPVELHLIEKLPPRGAEEPEAPAPSASTDHPAPGRSVTFEVADCHASTDSLAPVPPTPIEREARLAASRIHDLVAVERLMIPERGGAMRGVTWRDVALLLRSTPRAPDFLVALREAGVPAYLAAGGSLLEEEAVRDLHSLLQVIDNPRDDIALAALLRSPLFGLTDAELLRLRLARPGARSFLDAVAGTAYADDPDAERGAFWPPAGDAGPSFWTGAPAGEELIPGDLRARVREILDRIQVWRAEQGRHDLGRFLPWLMEETRFRAVLLGRGLLGRQRPFVEKYLAMARNFEAERGPSLHGFLARIAALEAAGGIEGVPSAAEDDDAVAILSVHKAKGLEFPIVVVPQLEWPFRPDLLGGKIRIGPQWVGVRHLDAKAWGRRDTTARQVLADLQDEEQRAEEARILYVALTRARERLILIGACRKRPWEDGGIPADVRAEMIHMRRCALEWIVSRLPWELARNAEPDAVGPPEGSRPGSDREPALVIEYPPVRVYWHSNEDGAALNAAASRDPGARDRDVAADVRAANDPLAANDARTGHDTSAPGDVNASNDTRDVHGRVEDRAVLTDVLHRIAQPPGFPPFAALPGLKGKYWATEFKRAEDATRARFLEEEGSGVWPDLPAEAAAVLGSEAAAPGTEAAAPGTEAAAPGSEAAATRGILYHEAIARLDLLRIDPESLDEQFDRIARLPFWRGARRDSRIEAGIASVLGSSVGRRMIEAAALHPAEFEREAAFSIKWSVEQLARFLPDLQEAIDRDPRWRTIWAPGLESLWALVQGRIDCVFRSGGEWIVLDWKTDVLQPGSGRVRAERYASQMSIYRGAASRIWGTPVRVFLAFLYTGEIVEMGTHD